METRPNRRTKAESGTSQPATRQGRASARYSRAEITRNRIIAVAVLVVLVILLVSLVSCIVRGIAGNSEQQAPASQPAAPAATTASETSANAEETSAEASLVGDVGSRVSDQTSSAQGVEDPWVESGRFATGDAELDRMIKDFCDANSSSDLPLEENAFNAYCIASWYEFQERDNNQYPTGPNWDIEYAKQAIEEGSVNCYEQAAFGEYVLKYFGYEDAVAMPSFILRQSGEYGDHGLLYVTDRDGRKCLCDPAFGANGWMLDADIYTVKAMDVGQDPADFQVADFEEVVKAPWM